MCGLKGRHANLHPFTNTNGFILAIYFRSCELYKRLSFDSSNLTVFSNLIMKKLMSIYCDERNIFQSSWIHLHLQLNIFTFAHATTLRKVKPPFLDLWSFYNKLSRIHQKISINGFCDTHKFPYGQCN